MSTEEPGRFGGFDDHVTRREILRTGGAFTLSMAGLGLLAGCGGGGGGSATTAGGTTQAGGAAVRGGTLRVGLTTGGSAETINPAQTLNSPDISRVYALYDQLYTVKPNLEVAPSLVSESDVSADAKTWTLRIRDGVTFHNGKEMTADDVVWSLRQWTKPEHHAYDTVGHLLARNGVRKVDPYTVRLQLKDPNARLTELLGGSAMSIIVDGDDGSSNVGSGPFKFGSFTQGQESVFPANKDYWQTGKPYVDELRIISSFSDDTARVNALRGGEIDIAAALPFLQAKQIQDRGAGLKLLNSESPAFQAMYMRVDKPPFDDVRVRQALRLAIDRQQLVDQVFMGLGTVGNDVPGKGVPFSLTDLTRERDVEQAKSLLKAAGQENLRVTLQTSSAGSGFVESAALFKEQARAAGITIDIKREEPGQYFNTGTLYLNMPFAQTYWLSVYNLQTFWSSTLTPSSTTNETHWPSSARERRLFAEANAAVDETRAAEAWGELQRQQYDEGGYIIWGQQNLLDGLADNVQGMTPSRYTWCGGWTFEDAWLGA
jgi:peptide/nickel transport system substrate-binding protein